MTPYLEIKYTVSPVQPWSEILMAELLTIGFDSFTEEADGIIGYIPKDDFAEDNMLRLSAFNQPDITIAYRVEEMPNINWNEEWEKNFQPIVVQDKVLIRAEFHEANPAMHELIIQPKMSFGTGHHPTTYLMVQQMMDMDFQGKSVLDMGAGTSVLAIYAKQLGAAEVDAIDIDEWAVENSRENAVRNEVQISISQGTSALLGEKSYDIILANINRNVLMDDIRIYSSVLKNGGWLLLSGLCFFDVDDILQECTANHLTFTKKYQREEWVSLLLQKQ